VVVSTTIATAMITWKQVSTHKNCVLAVVKHSDQLIDPTSWWFHLHHQRPCIVHRVTSPVTRPYSYDQ
jgi:hypothetical protein